MCHTNRTSSSRLRPKRGTECAFENQISCAYRQDLSCSASRMLSSSLKRKLREYSQTSGRTNLATGMAKNEPQSMPTTEDMSIKYPTLSFSFFRATCPGPCIIERVAQKPLLMLKKSITQIATTSFVLRCAKRTKTGIRTARAITKYLTDADVNRAHVKDGK